jgi:A/G-specific adenine glycosylase
MELGATICTPVKPSCSLCPLKSDCKGLALDQVSLLPTKVPKAKPIALKHEVWVPIFEDRLGVRQIPKGSWWEGMWEFPRSSVPDSSTIASDENKELRDVVGQGWLQYLGQVKHTVTNHRITIEVQIVHSEKRNPDLSWRKLSELKDLPMPAPQRKILALASNHLP